MTIKSGLSWRWGKSSYHLLFPDDCGPSLLPVLGREFLVQISSIPFREGAFELGLLMVPAWRRWFLAWKRQAVCRWLHPRLKELHKTQSISVTDAGLPGLFSLIPFLPPSFVRIGPRQVRRWDACLGLFFSSQSTQATIYLFSFSVLSDPQPQTKFTMPVGCSQI